MSGPASGEFWPAPAKLNLFLQITGRRADGYHELQTVFQFLDVADRLWFDVVDDGVIGLEGGLPDVPPEQDLIVRAAHSLVSHTGCDKGVRIRVDKRLPAGAGLGGGSSDAATTLVALNVLWGLGLGVDELAGLGLQLGADVPVFVYGFAAWAEGVGEQLTPMTDLSEPWYLVLNPALVSGPESGDKSINGRNIFRSSIDTQRAPAQNTRLCLGCGDQPPSGSGCAAPSGSRQRVEMAG